MANTFPDHLRSLLPANLTDVQTAILEALVHFGCVARLGQGPVLGSNTEASLNCRICLDSLVGELTLRHDGPPQDGQPPCRRTYHLNCLVDWAQSNLTQNRPITCPGDRQLLIPDDARQNIYDRFRLFTPPNHARIRPIDNVVRFWDVINPTVAHPPVINFGIFYIHPENALRLASMGLDVGFIDADIVGILPLLPEVRDVFDRYHNQRQQLPGRNFNDNTPWQRTFQTWIYVETGRQFINQDTGEESTDIMLVPVTHDQGQVFRRYLLGLLGEAYSVVFNASLLQIEVHRDILAEEEVINLHAETEIRRMMERDRAASFISNAVWFWPFPNRGGGIVVGGTLNGSDHPARGYPLNGINVGQANDQRFAMLTTNPLWDAVRRSNDLVDPYRLGRLPPGFSPDNEGLPGLVIGNMVGFPDMPPVVPFMGPVTSMGTWPIRSITTGPFAALNQLPPAFNPALNPASIQPPPPPQPFQPIQPVQPAQPQPPMPQPQQDPQGAANQPAQAPQLVQGVDAAQQRPIADHPLLPANPFQPGHRAPDPASFGIPNPFIRPP